MPVSSRKLPSDSVGRTQNLGLGNRPLCTVWDWILQSTTREFLEYSRNGLLPLYQSLHLLRGVAQIIVITNIKATAKALLGGHQGIQSPFTALPPSLGYRHLENKEEASETLALNLDFEMQTERHQMCSEVQRWGAPKNQRWDKPDLIGTTSQYGPVIEPKSSFGLWELIIKTIDTSLLFILK